MAQNDWIAIKNEYINTSISYRKLAEKHNVSFATLQQKAKKECWKNERDNQYDMTMTRIRQKTADVIVKKEVNRLALLLKLNDKLMQNALMAADQLTSALKDGEIVNTGMVDTFKMKQIAGVAKDLKDIQTMKTVDSSDTNAVNALMSAIKGENDAN